MIDFKVNMVGKYTVSQKTVYITPDLQILFNVKGLIRYHQPGLELTNTGAYFHIITQGTPVDFEYGPDREDWVIQLDTDAVRSTDAPGEIELMSEGVWIRLSAIALVPHEHVAGWQGEFIRMLEAFRDPHPRSRLRLSAGISNLLRYFLDQQPDTLRETPAMKLKRLISEDKLCARNLDELSRECGYSPDHIRKLFLKEYGMTPLDYRNRHRMAGAVSLLSNSNLTVKEVATAVGFRHVSHFCTMFRASCNMTPREAIKKYRTRRAD